MKPKMVNTIKSITTDIPVVSELRSAADWTALPDYFPGKDAHQMRRKSFRINLLAIIGAASSMLACQLALGQSNAEQSINRGIWSSPRPIPPPPQGVPQIAQEGAPLRIPGGIPVAR
jgi:hypothetical protein